MRPQSAVFLSIFIAAAVAQTSAPSPETKPESIPLVVSAGSPLRVYLTKRLPKREGEPVEAKLLEPLFAFDREVAPAGAEVLGRVSRLDNLSKTKRTMAILGGDFTPLHEAEVQFDTLLLPDGRRIALHTRESTGLRTIVPLHPRKPSKNSSTPANGGVLGTGKRQAQAQIDAAKDRVRGIADMVRGPDKKELLEDFLVSKLPYHPQWVKNGTRFDAELQQPLEFGSAPLDEEAVRLAGSQPPPDSIAHVRLLNTVNSGDAKQGSAVQAILTQPLFSADHKLIFPEGTLLKGSVTSVRKARWFHRGGQLRFNFQNVELPAVLAHRQPTAHTQATVASVEAAGAGQVKVSEEGVVTANEPKTRFIAPAISVLIANKSADNDTGKLHGGDANVGGRTLGGASGFGMLGAIAAQSSRTVGTAFGFWGMGVSIYTNIISKGSEVEFEKNAAMDIKFGARPQPPAASKFAGDGVSGGHE